MTTHEKHIGKGGLTGKRDIDGTEILDGDIMEYTGTKYAHPDPYIVSWSDYEAGFTCESATNFMAAAVWNQMRIIGNRFDNPGLVEACK